jgi:DNA-binding transcriptional MocR family regulator
MIPAFQGFLFGGGVNPFMSRVATYFLRDNLDAHVRLLIDVYRAKRDGMLKGLHEVLDGTDFSVNRPEGGFFLWMKLPTGTDQAKLAETAVADRVQYTRGPVFYANGGGEQFVRLAFSYETPEKNYEGARLLAKAILKARPR